MKKIVIIGAGLSGLSTAYQLKQGCSYLLFEKENSPGGLCRTVKKDGFYFDYTGHLLHLKSSDWASGLIKKLLRGNLLENTRNSWIFSKGVFTRYPFQENTCGLPYKVVNECVLGYLRAARSRKNGNISSFRQWILRSFGEGVAKHFMFPYNEKMWKHDLDKLGTQWLGSYVPRPSTGEVIDGAIFDKNSRLGYNASFYYPEKGGIQALSDGFFSRCKNVLLNCEVASVDLRRKKLFFKEKNSKKGIECDYDMLVNTMPLKEFLLSVVKDLPAGVRNTARALKYVSVLNVNLGVDNGGIPDKHWIYFPEGRYSFYRAGVASNFSKWAAPKGTSSIYTEIAYRPEDRREIESGKPEIVKKVCEDLVSAKVIGKKDEVIVKEVLDIRCAYVVYDLNYEKNLKLINEYLKNNSVLTAGRYGRWEYSAMEDAIREGKETAERIYRNI